ncbi:hypothetical protein [Sulfolobus monocaudavirus SMV3]|jgi:hypothetical protein|uniref:hypothetical protein n=1 Tax=Sulfolobus monocaudavirus SMV3 TaxID=1732177 RepID=UPI000705C9D1|nr:hypothetical protein AXI69_gp67 [Sulfolobus monocaudavirus SMV3]ALG97004.1 hypothetical protein [Sulfolobus monocaudavirus SMV3]
MKNISGNKYNNTIAPMTEEEYVKAREFYKFLVSITKCNNGILTIDREKLIDIASAYMDCTPIEAYNILLKMKSYGWVIALDKDYIAVKV